MLRSQDVLCSLKIACLQTRPEKANWSFHELATSLGLSKGEAYNAVNRSRVAGLLVLSQEKESTRVTVASKKLLGFLVGGLPTSFYAVKGPVAKGMPTGPSAQLLNAKILAPAIPVVWAWEGGKIQGETLVPLYPTVPMAAAADEMLYHLLVLVDVLRLGGPKEKKIAEQMLATMLQTSLVEKA